MIRKVFRIVSDLNDMLFSNLALWPLCGSFIATTGVAICFGRWMLAGIVISTYLLMLGVTYAISWLVVRIDLFEIRGRTHLNSSDADELIHPQ